MQQNNDPKLTANTTKTFFREKSGSFVQVSHIVPVCELFVGSFESMSVFILYPSFFSVFHQRYCTIILFC